MKNKTNSKGKSYRAYGVLTAVAFELVIFVVMGIYAGGWLDERYGLKGMGTILLIFFGLGLWIFILLRALKKLEKEN